MDLQNWSFKGITSSRASHRQEHEHADGDSNNEDIVGDEEGEVGDGDEEEGGDEGGDEGALHPPDEVQLKAEVGVLGVVAALLIVGVLGDSHTGHICTHDEIALCWRVSTHVNLLMLLTYHVNMVYVRWQRDVLVEHSLASPLKENLMGLVAEGLNLDFTRLHVHWVVGEVHLAADVEVDPF